ncbi:MAG TPA: TIGR04211 family SH3 domain-containing protein [Gammaproteobacteria bacterium]|nr:TIGR04211 family SH3 domain-containing protein [Gammaproteobacteria bacterium]
MKMFSQIVFTALCLSQLMLVSVAQARMIYINDNLRVGVRSEPSSRVAPFSVVVTGMKLEVLEQLPDYLKIRTAKGEVGWIKDIYVSDQPPAVMRIKTLKTRYQELKQQILEQDDSIKILETANLALNEQIDNLKKDRSRWQLEKARSDYLQQEAVNGRFWWWISLAGLLLVAAAFTSGMIWYRQQTMKRLGGLRV